MAVETTAQRFPRGGRSLLWALIAAILLVLLCLLIWFTLRPQPPVETGLVANPGGPYVTNEGEPLTFDGSGSTGADITDYSWDFGDGNAGGGISPTYTYPDGPAVFTTTLTITNAQGQTASASTQVTVQNLPPTANVGGPYACGVGQTIPLAGECDDPGPIDAESVTCTWADFSGAGVSEPNYTCPQTTGELMITLTATDKDGASAQDTTTITVSAEPPTATPTVMPTPTVTATLQPGENAAPVAVIEIHLQSKNGLKFGFDGAKSNDPDGQIVAYAWDFGDGNSAEGVEAVHEYTQMGNYTITLTVTDDKGATGTATATIP